MDLEDEAPGQPRSVGPGPSFRARRYRVKATNKYRSSAKYFLRVVKLSSAIGYYGPAGLVDHENARVGGGGGCVFGIGGVAMLRPNGFEIRTFGARAI